MNFNVKGLIKKKQSNRPWPSIVMLVKIDLVHGHFKKQKTKQKRGGEDLVDPTNTG
jgi:hypothetical protein